MTPQERQLIAELFDRLASLEGKPRDPEAERAIAEGLARAPHALYPLVQTVLVQDEALREADARIRELEGEMPAQGGGGFLDSMRDSLFGRREEQRGSVPSVRPGWSDPRSGQMPQANAPYPQPQAGGLGGGSFLGTAAASAAGVIGGALLLDSFRSMLGGGQRHAALDQNAGGDRSPWSGDNSGGDLARQAGADDIGRGGGFNNDGDRAGLFDTAQSDFDDEDGYDDGGGFDSDDV